MCDKIGRCLYCGKEFVIKYKRSKNIFCSKTCSTHYKGNKSHSHNDEQREKVRRSLRINSLKNKGLILDGMDDETINTVIQNYYNSSNKKLNEYTSICVVCGKQFTLRTKSKRIRKTCSETCRRKSLVEPGRKNGLLSTQAQQRRSKNEILMATLCKEYYGDSNVFCNKNIFNGWDADIIIPKLKIAILWNGIWHYKQISKSQSLEQVKSRDKLKIEQIKKASYKPYIIKDMGSYSKKFVLNEFNKFIELYPKLTI